MKPMPSGHNPVSRILRSHLSGAQLIGFILANVVGLFIIMAAVRFYADLNASDGAGSSDSFVASSDFVTVNKRVEGLPVFGASSATSFSPEEIADLESQPWVRRLAPFSASDFDVNASVDMGGRGMSTALFFESVPDSFFDTLPPGWSFSPDESTEVPIILSRDYLALYNFGFAAGRGLPQLSEAMIGMIPLRISLSGNGNQTTLRGRVVGFSSRLNTIAVPDSFLSWANSVFSSASGPAATSRLLIEVSDPGDPAVAAYLSGHSLEIGGDKESSSRALHVMNVITGVILAVGAVITILAVVILLLSMLLLLQRQRRNIHLLLSLGYRPSLLLRPYLSTVLFTVIISFIISSAALLFVAPVWQKPLASVFSPGASPLLPFAVGAAISLLIIFLNALALLRVVKSNFRISQ